MLGGADCLEEVAAARKRAAARRPLHVDRLPAVQAAGAYRGARPVELASRGSAHRCWRHSTRGAGTSSLRRSAAFQSEPAQVPRAARAAITVRFAGQCRR